MTDPTPTGGLRGAVDLSALVQHQQPSSAAGGSGAPAGGDAIVFATDDASFGSALELSRTVPVVVAPPTTLLGSNLIDASRGARTSVLDTSPPA